jgi:uncharacterized protein with FMN-binding domain
MFPRRGAIAIALTAVALVVLINVKTPDQLAAGTDGATGTGTPPAIVGTADPGTGTTDSGIGTTDSGTAGSGTQATPAPTTAPAVADATVTGPEVDTRFGPVQVEVTVQDGQVTDVTALQLPSGGRSGRISSAAEPILREEALQAQSANIDTVSGATYTSLAYEQSLQAALDSAGI